MSTENLNNQEAIEKLQEIINKIDVGMLSTYPNNTEYVHAVPMSRQEVDEQGNVWYLFSSESDTFKHLQQSKKVSLLYADQGSYTFLSINGIAEVSSDKARIEKYWNKMMEGWFEKGKDDPTIRVLKVTPLDAYYWSTKSNKVVTLLRVAASAITGQYQDVGLKGELNI